MEEEVKIPEVGESITEGTLVEWHKQEGVIVKVGDPLFELETDKVTLTVPSEFAGRLHIMVGPGEKVRVGQVVATIDTEAAKAAGKAGTEAPAPEPPGKPEAEWEEKRSRAADAASKPSEAKQPPPRREAASPAEPSCEREAGGPGRAGRGVEPPQTEGPAISPPAGFPQAGAKLSSMAEGGSLSPAVRRMVEEFHLDSGTLVGTGKEGRITKEDVLRHIRKDAEVPPEPEEERPGEVRAERTPPPEPEAPSPTRERQTRRRMSALRQRTAERLVMAQHNAAILTTFNEADMANVMALREKFKQAFRGKYGVGLGFMSFFIKACVDALRTVPQVNAQIQGDEIVENHYYDIGVAISSDRGLVVPVIREADRLNFAEIERAIVDLTHRIQEKKITLADLSGGVFTISNGGVFGSMMSTPILNPPQGAILGMHAIKKRPVLVNDEVAVRPMMYLALSYDHRLIDGREAVSFLKRIVECIENPDRMMLEV